MKKITATIMTATAAATTPAIKAVFDDGDVSFGPKIY